jgi:hypothetical protein
MEKLNTTSEVLDAVRARMDIAPYAKLVGQWVWAEFPHKPSDDTRAFLKGIGFRWNNERMAWQHACGVYRRQNRRIDPRMVYGQRAIESEC